jgi:transcriptional regulator of acetoin/glycerol metabolism
MLRRKPKPIESDLSEDDLQLFTEIATRKQVSPDVLLKQIIQQWLQEERNSTTTTSEIVLPKTCAVLLENETLRQFTARVNVSLINVVVSREGGFHNAARRLRINRSALHKKLKRLTQLINPETKVESETAESTSVI